MEKEKEKTFIDYLTQDGYIGLQTLISFLTVGTILGMIAGTIIYLYTN